MPFGKNENLNGALRASLRLIELEQERETQVPPQAINREPGNVTPNANSEPSPLSEVDPDSINVELDRINEHLIAGTPEKITDESLERIVDLYRAQALKWEQDEQTKKTKTPSRKRTHVEAMEL